MISSIISRLVILLFGTLYPAYASYKAVKTKNVKEYVKWMMYWIVFALFTCTETFTDVFLSWFPFYYEIKVILVLWLLSPATRGSSILYRKFVHPMLSSREQEIDEYIAKAREQSYKQVLDLGSKGVNVLMQTAIKGGGGIVNQLRKSYSLSDLTDSPHSHMHEDQTETDSFGDLNLSRKKRSHVTASSSSLYFTEVDVRQDVVTNIKSTDDISSGYSSGEVLFSSQSKVATKEGVVRSGSISSTRSKSLRVTRSTTPKKLLPATDTDDDSEYESQEEDVSDFDTRNKLTNQDNIKNLTKIKDELLNFSNEHENQQTNAIALISLPELQNTFMASLYKSKSVDSLNIPNQPVVSARAGKYNKKAAPLPPKSTTETEKPDESSPTIRATLVLKPGTLAPVKPDHMPKELLLQSKSKSKKKGVMKSKEGSPFTRFLTLPKKFTFWSQHEDEDEDFKAVANFKRSSWYTELPNTAQLFLSNSKPLSKSAENFHIGSLMHSPKFRIKSKNLDPQAD